MVIPCVSVDHHLFSSDGEHFCFCARLFATIIGSLNVFSIFVINLTLSDFLMGVYMAIIGAADETFYGSYLTHDETWKDSVLCKMAGFLCLLSSEVSALAIGLITLDRFIVLRFPFSTVRFSKASAALACFLIWSIGLLLALVPLLPVTSHWEFYSQTGICIPLPVTRNEFKGKLYSFSVFIVLNFVLFLASTGQAVIYWSIHSNSLKPSTCRMARDMTIAQRLITVGMTDLLCWFPIGVCGVLASCGVAIPGEVNVALAIFILPLNSAVNPFMYTFNAMVQNRKKRNETKFLHWLESQKDVIMT